MPKKRAKLIIDITDSDCQDLIEGKTFDWSFTTDTGIEIDLHLFNPDKEEE